MKKQTVILMTKTDLAEVLHKAGMVFDKASDVEVEVVIWDEEDGHRSNRFAEVDKIKVTLTHENVHPKPQVLTRGE